MAIRNKKLREIKAEVLCEIKINGIPTIDFVYRNNKSPTKNSVNFKKLVNLGKF